MELKVKTSGSVVLTEELTAYIEKKTTKLMVFIQNDPTALVEVEAGSTSAGQRTGDVFRGEVHITFAGGDVYAEAAHHTLHGALDKAVDNARRELRRKWGRTRDITRKGAAQVKNFFRNFGK